LGEFTSDFLASAIVARKKRTPKNRKKTTGLANVCMMVAAAIVYCTQPTQTDRLHLLTSRYLEKVESNRWSWYVLEIGLLDQKLRSAELFVFKFQSFWVSLPTDLLQVRKTPQFRNLGKFVGR
jgi:hypothetical protein